MKCIFSHLEEVVKYFSGFILIFCFSFLCYDQNRAPVDCEWRWSKTDGGIDEKLTYK
jgi:hypothetical protein